MFLTSTFTAQKLIIVGPLRSVSKVLQALMAMMGSKGKEVLPPMVPMAQKVNKEIKVKRATKEILVMSVQKGTRERKVKLVRLD